MSARSREFLRRLSGAGPDGVLLSDVPKGQRGILRQLCECRAARLYVAKRAERVAVDDSAAFERFVADRFPGGLDSTLPADASRTDAAGLFGDAKAVRRGRYEGLFVRSVLPQATLRNRQTGVTLSVGQLTATAGGAAVLLEQDSQWSFSGTVALVGNAEPFWRHETVLPDVGLAVFTNGKMSTRLLQWLQSPAMSQCTYIVWDDYDPAGVREYARLSAVCPGRVGFFMPTLVEELLPQYGKASLVSEQQVLLTALRGRAADAIVERAIALFDQHGRGLEQEVLAAHMDSRRGTTP